MERTNVIDMQGIVKRYYEGEPNELEILHGIDLKVFQGEFVSIVGESGSGKSTLMNMIGALDRPTEGQYFLGGRDISKLQDEELQRYPQSGDRLCLSELLPDSPHERGAQCRDSAHVCQHAAKAAQRACDGTFGTGWYGRKSGSQTQ